MPSALNLVRTNLKTAGEQWKKDHVDAMKYWDFIEFVTNQVENFRRLCRVDDAIREAVYSHGEEFDPSIYEIIDGAYAGWLDVAQQILENAHVFDSTYGTNDKVEELRDCVKLACGIVTPDEKFFDHDKLVAERDDAIDEFLASNRDEPADDAPTVEEI